MNHNTTYPNEPHAGYPAGGPTDSQYGPGGHTGQAYGNPQAGPGGATTSAAQGSAPGSHEQRNSGVKHTLVGLHGAGDALRGSIGAAVDNALGHHESAARNRDVMERGIAEMRDGSWRGGAHAPVNAQEQQQQLDNGRVRRHGGRETRKDRKDRKDRRDRSRSSSCSSCEERKQGKPRVIHNSHMLNKMDPRVRPSDRQAWADGVSAEEIRARDRKDPAGAAYAGEGLGADHRVHPGQQGYNNGVEHRENLGHHGLEHRENLGHHSVEHRENLGHHGADGVSSNAAARIELTEAGYPATPKQLSTEKHDHGNRLLNKLDPRVDADTAPSNIDYGAYSSNESHNHHAGPGNGYEQTPVNGRHAGHHAGQGAGFGQTPVNDRHTGAHGYDSGYGSQGVAGQQSYANEPVSHGAVGRREDGRVLEEQPVHGSKLLNKLDPRVDSKAVPAGAEQRYAENTYPQQSYDNPHSSNYGPHSTNAGNMVDPHVDSHPRSYDNPRSGNYGPHSTNVANRVDPNVDPYNRTNY